jgi:ribose 5-phosphate isomerase B
VDCGPSELNSEDDYVDFGVTAITKMQAGDIAILICGSGHGMDILANRHQNIRAILGFNEAVVKQGREHEDANVLILPSDWTSSDQAIQLSNVFLDTPFSNDERHLRRLEKIKNLNFEI